MIRAAVTLPRRSHHRAEQAAGPALARGQQADPACRRAGRGADLRAGREAAAGAPAGQGHVGPSAAGTHARCGGEDDAGLPRPRHAQDLLGRRRRQPLPRLGTIRFGLVKAPGHGAGGEGEKMLCLHPREVDSDRGRQAGDDRLRGAVGAWRSGQLGGDGACDRAHPPAARAYGGAGASDHRGWQIRRVGAGKPRRWLGRAAGRRDQPQAAPACPAPELHPPGHRRARHPDRALARPHAAHMGHAGLGRARRARRPVRGAGA